MYGQLLCFLREAGLEADLGPAVEDLGDDVFNPPNPPAQPSPPVCTYHCSFVTDSATGLQPVQVHGGKVVLWRGLYQPQLAKNARTDGDALVQWAIGGTLPRGRPRSVWHLINDAPPFSHAKEGERGGWTFGCP